jgi:hypothetical protein
MTTELLDPVHEGQTYTVKITNTSLKGTVLLVIGWVSKQAHVVPDSKTVSVAAAAPTVAVTGTVPQFADARRMTVVASLDAGETATLELLENGVSKNLENITETTVWEMLVDTVSQ